LSYLANTQTDKQTNRQTKSGKNITSLAEVTKCYRFLLDISSQIVEQFGGQKKINKYSAVAIGG